MKKSTMFAAALMLAGASLTAQAQELYICGPFNDFTPDGNSEWMLELDEDADPEIIFRKTFFIPAGEFQVNFQIQTFYLTPADENTLQPSQSNVSVLTDDTFFSGPLEATGLTNVCWECPNWAGGDVEVVVDLEQQYVIFSTDVAPQELWYIRGEFNGYDPAGNPAWALTPSDDPSLNGVFTGAFTVPAGEFSFNLLNPYGQIFVPLNTATFEGTTEAVIFTDGVFTGNLIDAFDETEESCYWTYGVWEGGDIVVTVDLNESTIEIVAVPGEPAIAPYLVGEFNNYGEDGVENWTLEVTDDEMSYRGEFYIPEGQLKFKVGFGMTDLVPAVLEDGELVAASENVSVLAPEDEGFWLGEFCANGVSNIYWEKADWAGGVVEFTVDFRDNLLILSSEAGELDAIYLNGAFNDYTPGAEWVLLPSQNEAENGVYVGNVEIPEGKFSFNLIQYGQYLVPLNSETFEPETAVVEFANDVYESQITLAYEGEENMYWTLPDWEGGKVQVSLDFNEALLTIVVLEGSGVGSVNAAGEGKEVIFNLNGVRVNGDNALKGIYIVNGKKVVKM